MKQRSTISVLYDKVPEFVDELIKITNTKHVTIQIAIMGVVVEMSRSLGDKIVDHFPKFLPFMKKFFEDANASSQLKIYSLQTI